MRLRVIKGAGVILGILVAFLRLTFSCHAQNSEASGGAELTADQIASELIGYMHAPGIDDKIRSYPLKQVSVLKKASIAEPKIGKYHFAIYVYEMVAGERKEALKEIEAAYNLSGNDPQYLMQYVLALKMNWEPIKARDVLAGYSKAHGKPVQFEAQVAQLNITIQEYAAALPAIQRYLKHRDGFVPAEETILLLEQGTCELYLGKTEKAIATFKKALATFSKNESAKAECAVAMIKSGNPKGALDLLEKDFHGHFGGDTLYFKGVALEAVGRSSDAKLVYAEALKEGEADLKINDDNGKDHFYLSQICTKLGIKEKAKYYRSNATLLHFTFEPPFSTNAVKDPGVQK